MVLELIKTSIEWVCECLQSGAGEECMKWEIVWITLEERGI